MDSIKNRRIEILLEEFRNKNIYLYGAGTRGRVALENLNHLGLGNNIVGYIDDVSQGDGGMYCDKQVWTIRDVCQSGDLNAIFIISTYAVSEMCCKLMKNNIPSERIYFLPELLVDDIDINIFRNNKDKIRKVYEDLEDFLSKYIYKSLFDVYLNGNIGILSRTKGDLQYFPIGNSAVAIQEFLLLENECFIDCGAFDGDTIKSFKNVTGDKYSKIWAFEPESNNFRRLSDYVNKENDARIKIIKGGVYNEDNVMSFCSDRGTSSTLNNNGNDSIEVYKMDSLINERVSFIKMDIEGSEKEALLGAQRIISECKPKLAICIYHKIEDLWEIPLLIKTIRPDYHIYIRNYKDRVDETVCYAI